MGVKDQGKGLRYERHFCRPRTDKLLANKNKRSALEYIGLVIIGNFGGSPGTYPQ